MSGKERVFTGTKVLLPDSETLVPATIIVDTLTGKIIDVRQGRSSQADFPSIPNSDFIDAENKVLLPGLVEYVPPIAFRPELHSSKYSLY